MGVTLAEDVLPETVGDRQAAAANGPQRARTAGARPAPVALRRLRIVVAVQHHGQWFYIPHSDHTSKLAFGLLAYLFQMQSPQQKTVGPILTVPVG